MNDVLQAELKEDQTHAAADAQRYNIGDLLKEHRMIIHFDTDEVEISDEFWEEVYKEAALFQEKYEGSDIFISTLKY